MRFAIIGVTLSVLALLLTMAVHAPAIPPAVEQTNARCQEKAATAVRKLADAVIKEVARCHVSRLRGDIGASVDCNAIAALPASSAAKIQKTAERIAKASDKSCNASGASLPPILGYASCPVPCNAIATDDWAGLGDCLVCATGAMATSANQSGHGMPAAPAGGDETSCLGAIGKALRTALITRLKEQIKCAAWAANGDPEALAADCRTADLDGRIQKVTLKVNAMIARCGSDAVVAALASCGASIPAVQTCVNQTAETQARALYDLLYPTPPLNPDPADLVLRNGIIHTVDAANPSAEAVAIRNGQIVYVGSNQGSDAWYGPTTTIIDLKGKLVLPGIHDVHQHVVEASSPVSGTCELPSDTDPESMIPTLQDCAPLQIGTNWVLGFGYSIASMLATGRDPVDILDDAIPVQPAAMLEETSHSVWVNSAALAVLGITAASPDPAGGIIGKNAAGQPNGLLFENAGELAFEKALQPTPQLDELKYQGLLDGMALLAQNGITSIVDARAYRTRNDQAIYQRALAAGTLTARTILSLWAYPHFNDTTQIADLIALYDNDPTSLLRLSQVKMYGDGLIQNGTAALLAPYNQDLGIAGPLGLNYFDETRLTTYVTQLELAGFDLHIHTIGDRAVREALNAIESATTTNGPRDRRHRLTHVELVDTADRPRFRQLGVIADFQVAGDFTLPASWPFEVPRIGSRAFEQVPVRSIYDTGAVVTLSSDYDVSPLSPFLGMEHSLIRNQHSLPDIRAAIRAYTLDAAYLERQEDRTGSIEVGKVADLIVVNKNILEIPTSQISTTKVLLTLLGGTEVYRAPGF